MQKLAIHIGLHKTGTTFLQDVIFSGISSIELICGVDSHRELMKADFAKQVVISDENISGNLWGGGYFQDFIVNINKIIKIYGDPKIIFGIRKTEDLLLSIYKQYLHEKGFEDVEYLYNLKNSGIIRHEDLLYDPRISILNENFSEVFIYSQESLRDNFSIFLTALMQFLELDNTPLSGDKFCSKRNVGVKTKLQVNFLRDLNRLSFSLGKVSPLLSLYSRPFRRFNLTPRKVCQDYITKIPSSNFELESDLVEFMQDYYLSDWKKSISKLSY